ncbi:hypothetical protein THF1C08_50258 [Vibrio jasicida]|uniref:Uncharacterized protein n=1 Tax=Vibrio jasicida TaxID=766224 RepID=A0AAU9QUD5_9VIBR|nr:hypothetical protein THF1C08_50258 [Vibrio jasicida]CAH1601532.1 hypothetical protein THF1A12_50089 [Vibrio jasicida]
MTKSRNIYDSANTTSTNQEQKAHEVYDWEYISSFLRRKSNVYPKTSHSLFNDGSPVRWGYIR